MSTLKGKTLIITGASRGIGREIALRAAKDGANVVIAAKTSEPNPKLEGTIHSVAKEVEAAGGKALPFQVDVRNDAEVGAMVAATVAAFGGIDILVNNAGAINLTPTEETPMKRFDLMHQINVRAVFSLSQAVIPFLKKSQNAHILNMSPPIALETRWMKPHLAYTLSKYGMTMCTLGMAEEFKHDDIRVNSLWPKYIIATAATQMLFRQKELLPARKPSIMADAAYAILTTTDKTFTGQALLDEEFLRSRGEKDFEKYAISREVAPMLDIFVTPDSR